MAPSADRRDVRIAIIGSGFGGLGAAIQLQRHGIEDFVVLERADDVGGTWRDNSYPGCACDVQSHLYSFSFAPNPDWSHSYSGQPEIWAYLQRCAREFGVLPQIRFGHEMRTAAWDDVAQCWRIETSRGTFTASALVLATGPLSDPMIPKLPGLDTFEGRVFHSAQWDRDFDLTGRRVAVIGTGASAVQFVPAIQPQVDRLYVFQRTAPWILPRPGHKIGRPLHSLFRHVPSTQRALRGLLYSVRELMVPFFRRPALMQRMQRLVLLHLKRAVPDPVLRAKLTPDFTMGCKRMLLSNNYLPTLTRPNVAVVTAGISEIRSRTIRTADGTEHEVDAIIFGTGFQPTDQPIARSIRGRDGRTLGEVWAGSPQAHLGTMVSGFPNLFFLLGPNSGLGHNSVVYMVEAQIAHLLSALQYLDRQGGIALEPRPEAQAAFVAAVDRRMHGTVWVSGGCRSWYLDKTGRNSTLWPDFSWQYRRRVARLNPAEYVLTRATPARPAPPLTPSKESLTCRTASSTTSF